MSIVDFFQKKINPGKKSPAYNPMSVLDRTKIIDAPIVSTEFTN